MGAKLYRLTWLDYNLRHSGLAGRCYKYKLSEDSSSLFISYLDKFLGEQFVFVFRTSRYCYRIYYLGELLTARTAHKATEILNGILVDLVSQNEYLSVMTVAEFNSSKQFTHSQKMDLFRRKR